MKNKVEVAVVLFLAAVLFLGQANSYKILGVFPFAARSHYLLESELMKGLAEAGHDATIITVYEEKNPPKNGKYRQIFLKEAYDEQIILLNSVRNWAGKKNEARLFKNPFQMVSLFNTLGYKVSELVLNHTKTQNLIKSGEKFDIVIVSQFFMEAPKALAPYFDSHLVIFNTVTSNSWMNHFVGNSMLPSLAPEIVLGFTGNMNLKERLINTLIRLLCYFNHNLLQYPSQIELVHKYISKDIDLYKTQYNVSLVLSNGHTSLNPAGTAVPCMKDIAGFHVRPPKKLPEDLQKYLDGAKDGVIYFSMGSNFKSTFLPLEIRDILMKVFSERKEQVLWKFEDDSMPGKPANVRIEKWLPQSDLLAHPNIKLFITHGGFLSTVETVYHGVPTVAIPLGADQQQNARVAESIGFTKMLDFSTLTEEVLADAIEEVISNKKYRESARHRSKIFHDRPMKPLDEAIYWLEYIVRHNGAHHLRVEYLHLAWYQYYLLDVFGIIFAVIFAAYLLITKTICWIFRKMFKRKTVDKKTKKAKKQ